jgi:transposase
MFPGYRITEDGRVLSTLHPGLFKDQLHQIATVTTRIGYVDCILVDWKGKRRHKYLHRLVAECWVDNPGLHWDVHHIDHDKQNNHASNLEWVSHGENKRRDCKRKMSKEQDTEAIKMYQAGIGQNDIADKFGVSQSEISRVICEAGASKKRRCLSKSARESIILMHEAGNKKAVIAKIFEVSIPSVCAIIRRGKPKNEHKEVSKWQQS